MEAEKNLEAYATKEMPDFWFNSTFYALTLSFSQNAGEMPHHHHQTWSEECQLYQCVWGRVEGGLYYCHNDFLTKFTPFMINSTIVNKIRIWGESWEAVVWVTICSLVRQSWFNRYYRSLSVQPLANILVSTQRKMIITYSIFKKTWMSLLRV